ncbi:hypothetical protein ANRL2_00734 [Anaerolineae bacterium]|nr:hypothetical protein ANRL2_00734 [Anaerolineae bacterium]
MSLLARLKKVATFLIAGIVVSYQPHAHADGQLLWAGFAFSGDYANRAHLYPVSTELAAEMRDGQPYLDKLLREKAKAIPEVSALINFEGGNGKLDLSSLGFALVQEHVETQVVSNKYWVLGTLQANVLIFNKATSSMVASYPLRVRHATVLDHMPQASDKKSIIRALYESADPKENVFDQWLSRLTKIKLRGGARKYLRVSEIVIAPEAESTVRSSGKDLTALKNQVANILEAALGEKANASFVPYSGGEVVANKMALTFSNGEFTEIKLPDPDYGVTFTIRNFIRKTVEQPSVTQDIYRVLAGIGMKEPLSGRVYLDEGIYHTQIQTNQKSANMEVVAWDQHYKVLHELIFMTAESLANPTDSWWKDHVSHGPDAKQGFMQAKQILQELNK